jgi:2-methylaconitate cis-trans-isomerase PrpF
MPLHSIRAVFMRGGTSKALVFHAADLPASQHDWNSIFLAATGSPDPNGRQLDGMGGGVSSLSKVCVVGPPSRPDADVDYTFAQIAIGSTSVDYAGNCGNMSSAIGPFAIDEGLVKLPSSADTAVVRIHNTNTGKIIVSRFPVANGKSDAEGDQAIDGVAGTAAPVRLDFVDPAGSKTGTLLPTGQVIDILSVPGVGEVRASLVDAANPTVLMRAADFGMTGAEMPGALERDTALLAKLETVRQYAAVAMGLAPDLAAAARLISLPKLALLSPPMETTALSGRTVKPEEADIGARMISVGQPHRAVPITAALCLAVGCRIPGTIAADFVRSGDDPNAPLRIAHPSGVMMVAADVSAAGNRLEVRSATVFRTARRLFQGEVCYRVSHAQAA